MIDDFDEQRFDVSGVEIAADIGGSGPPVLLLHGYPQTRWMWRAVAPTLATRYTVVAADLRGYGDSAKPLGDATHEAYSKRAMAADQIGVMEALGFDRFTVVGHDRGARVAHRMCLDAPDRVAAAAVLDIVPTRYLFERTDAAFASAYYHWFFLSQAPDLPETLIGAAARAFLETTLERWSGPGFTFDRATLDRYVTAFTPDVIRASCEDYRAAATIDLEHDAADADRRVECPLLVLWGAQGAMERLYDVPATWRDRATHVTTRSLATGHFLPEEAPKDTAATLIEFLAGVPAW